MLVSEIQQEVNLYYAQMATEILELVCKAKLLSKCSQ